VRLDVLTTTQLDEPLRRRLVLDQGEQWLRSRVQESIAVQNPAQADPSAGPQ
jgi:hypothetical protein